MQSFWVRASTVGASNLELTNNMVMQDNNTDNKLKAPAADKALMQLVRVQVSNESVSDELVIYTHDQALNGFDSFDSPKMSNESATIPEISTVVNGESLVINGVNELMLDNAYPVRFMTNTGGAFSILANELSNLPEGVKVILSDNGVETDLTTGAAYGFTSDVTDNSNRFSLIFRSPGTVNGLETSRDNRILVYAQSKSIWIKVSDDKLLGSAVSVYNALGQKVISTTLDKTTQNIVADSKADIYFVKVGGATKRVVVQ